MLPCFRPSSWSPATVAGLVRLALVAGFVWLVGRYWHPYYGFTELLQANEETEATLPAPLRDAPIYIHRGEGRYDGAYYALIAADPALTDPALAPATLLLGYRARRILLSAVAWVVGGGEPVAAVHAYAWGNVVLWFVLAVLAWRIFPPREGARATFAWMALLFGATLLSVRLALTDLGALVLLAAALILFERGRAGAASAMLGLAGLARETALLAAASLAPVGDRERRRWLRRAGLAALAAAPLAAWLWHIRWAPGAASGGADNFTLPLAGLIGRTRELWRMVELEPNRALLAMGWLDHGSLLVQMAFLFRCWKPDNPWWRVGFAYALLACVLGSAVWEGLPGAATRVLLPMTLAFNVLAVRQRAAWTWLVCGNCMILSGLWSLQQSGRPHEIAAEARGGRSFVLETDRRWSVAEWNRGRRWAWCAGEGGLVYRQWPHDPQVRLELQVRGITPRELQVWHGGERVWSGRIGDRPEWIALPELPLERGRLQLELRSPAPPVAEGVANTARQISFACFGARPVE